MLKWKGLLSSGAYREKSWLYWLPVWATMQEVSAQWIRGRMGLPLHSCLLWEQTCQASTSLIRRPRTHQAADHTWPSPKTQNHGEPLSIISRSAACGPACPLNGMVEEPIQSHCSCCSHSSLLLPVTVSKIRGTLWDTGCQQKIINSLVFNSSSARNYCVCFFFLCEMWFL